MSAGGVGRSVALVAAALLVGCGGERAADTPAAAAAGAPDIILITVDTLRADHVGATGYPRRTTPFIDSLAAAGTRFANAYSTSSWTAPAMVSIFTARYPSTHGVVHGLVAEGRVEHQEVIPSSLPTLTEGLKAAGYETFGISANRHLAHELGFGRGFDHYECVGFETADRVHGGDGRAVRPDIRQGTRISIEHAVQRGVELR